MSQKLRTVRCKKCRVKFFKVCLLVKNMCLQSVNSVSYNTSETWNCRLAKYIVSAVSKKCLIKDLLNLELSAREI
jgi:hypothetical protein